MSSPDEVVNKIIETLQADATLTGIGTWSAVNGVVPGKSLSISAGCDTENYEPYTQDKDQCTAQMMVYISLDNRILPAAERRPGEERLAQGDRAIRRLAHIVRASLVENRKLGGVINDSFPRKVEYLATEDLTDLHIAAIHLDADFFVERSRPKSVPTVAQIVLDVKPA